MDRKEVQRRVALLKPIDDIFFEKLMESKAVCQEILQVILEDDQLEVLSVVSQRSIRNLQGRSVRLDALCRLKNGALCNVEVQKANNDDHLKRVRYNASCITANTTDVGTRFESVSNVCVIYISRFDVFDEGKVIYHVDSVVRESGKVINDGLERIFVNTKIKDGSVIGELMECFEQTEVQNERFPQLSSEVEYYKKEQKGRKAMCDVVESYARDYAKEYGQECAAKQMINTIDSIAENLKLSIEEVVKSAGISFEEYQAAKELLAKSQQEEE